MNTKPLLALAALITLTSPALAHRFWILPSATVLSGDEPWVTFDAAVSNNLFFADHVAPPLEAGLQRPEDWIRWLAVAAIALTTINMFGGFAVTQRMLTMFRK